MNQAITINKLPLPENFNGYEWDTKIQARRKCIPKYLHENLPALKYQQLRQQFKQVSKFECPKMDYFQIKSNKKQTKNRASSKSSQTPFIKLPQQFSNLKTYKTQKTAIIQQWQYAILTNDKQSNVLNMLIQKSDQFDRKRQDNQMDRGIKKIKKNKKIIRIVNDNQKKELEKQQSSRLIDMNNNNRDNSLNLQNLKTIDRMVEMDGGRNVTGKIRSQRQLLLNKSLQNSPSNKSNHNNTFINNNNNNKSFIFSLSQRIPSLFADQNSAKGKQKQTINNSSSFSLPSSSLNNVSQQRFSNFSKKQYKSELKTSKYFENTVQLMFRHEKQKILKQMKQKQINNEEDIKNNKRLKQYKERISKIVDGIRLDQY